MNKLITKKLIDRLIAVHNNNITSISCVLCMDTADSGDWLITIGLQHTFDKIYFTIDEFNNNFEFIYPVKILDICSLNSNAIARVKKVLYQRTEHKSDIDKLKQLQLEANKIKKRLKDAGTGG